MWVDISVRIWRPAGLVDNLFKVEKREINLTKSESGERNVTSASGSKKRVVTLEKGQPKNALKSIFMLENSPDFSICILNGGISLPAELFWI